MPLKNKKSGKTLESSINKVVRADYNWIRKSKHFKFDWKVESENEIYKIFLFDEKE